MTGTMIWGAKKIMACVGIFGLCLFLLTGCATQAPEPNQAKAETSFNFDAEALNELLAYEDAYLGDSLVIKEILKQQLPGKEYLQSFDITLDRLTINYAPAKEFDVEGEAALVEAQELAQANFAEYWQEPNSNKVLLYNATALAALIKNLETIEFNVEGYDFPTCVITKANLDSFYGVDLKTVTTAKKWQETILKGDFFTQSAMEGFYQQNPLSAKQK